MSFDRIADFSLYRRATRETFIGQKPRRTKVVESSSDEEDMVILDDLDQTQNIPTKPLEKCLNSRRK